MKTTTTDTVRYKEKISYASIHFSHSLLSTTALTFILYYYTDVLLLPAAAVSVILLIVRIFDGAINPFIGYYMDNRRTRYGKYKGYLYYWAVPLCVLSVLLFSPVPFENVTGTVIWCFLVYMAWSFVYSMVEEASLPLIVLMSGDTKERQSINSIKIAGAILATLGARYFTLELAEAWGGENMQKGFFGAILIFAAVALVGLLWGAAGVVEHNTAALPEDTRISFVKTVKTLLRDRALLFLLLFFLFMQMGYAVKAQASIYYMKYFVNRPDLTSLLLTIGVVSSLSMQPVILFAANRVSYTKLMAAGCAGAAVSILIMGFAGPFLPLLILGDILMGITTAFPANLIYIAMADVSDQCMKEKGGNFSAFVHSLLGLVSKLGLSVAGAVIALVLHISSYVPNIAQEGASLTGIQVAFVLLTFMTYLIAAIFMIGFIRCNAKKRKERSI